MIFWRAQTLCMRDRLPHIVLQVHSHSRPCNEPRFLLAAIAWHGLHQSQFAHQSRPTHVLLPHAMLRRNLASLSEQEGAE